MTSRGAYSNVFANDLMTSSERDSLNDIEHHQSLRDWSPTNIGLRLSYRAGLHRGHGFRLRLKQTTFRQLY